MRIRKEILKADKILDEASRQLPFSTVTPINEQKVRADFLKGKIKNPILKYAEPHEDLVALRRKVASFTLEERDVLDSLIIEKQHDIIRKIDLLNSIGCFDFTEKSIKLYGLPDKRLVDKCYELLAQPKEQHIKSENMLSKDAISLLRSNFKKHGLKYQIKRDTLVGNCDVEPTHSRIVLKKKVRFSKHLMNKLVVHEIGCHVFRYENGKQNKLNLFCHGLADYLETEEGLALYVEELFGLRAGQQVSAGLVIAVHLSQQHDFYTTFKKLRKYFSPQIAFRLTLRAKRGLSDTSAVGGYTKDHLYLKGYFNVKDWVEKGGDIKELYVGKVGIKDLPALRELKLKKPKFLPKDFILVNEGMETIK